MMENLTAIIFISKKKLKASQYDPYFLKIKFYMARDIKVHFTLQQRIVLLEIINLIFSG